MRRGPIKGQLFVVVVVSTFCWTSSSRQKTYSYLCFAIIGILIKKSAKCYKTYSQLQMGLMGKIYSNQASNNWKKSVFAFNWLTYCLCANNLTNLLEILLKEIVIVISTSLTSLARSFTLKTLTVLSGYLSLLTNRTFVARSRKWRPFCAIRQCFVLMLSIFSNFKEGLFEKHFCNRDKKSKRVWKKLPSWGRFKSIFQMFDDCLIHS